MSRHGVCPCCRQLASRSDQLEQLLIDTVGDDRRSSAAAERLERTGVLTDWNDFVAAGLDPTTGEPIDGGQR